MLNSKLNKQDQLIHTVTGLENYLLRTQGVRVNLHQESNLNNEKKDFRIIFT